MRDYRKYRAYQLAFDLSVQVMEVAKVHLYIERMFDYAELSYLYTAGVSGGVF